MPQEQRKGGLLDEMKIQPSVDIERKGQFITFVGFTDMDIESNVLSNSRIGSLDPAISDHVLQITFTTYNVLRFPIAHFPNNQATAAQIHHLFWKAVSILDSIDFIPVWMVLKIIEHVCVSLVKMPFQEKCPMSVQLRLLMSY